MVHFRHKGNFSNTEKLFKRAKNHRERVIEILNEHGRRGVEALSAATPVESGKTAAGWGYEITSTGTGYSIVFTNSNVNKGVNIAVILQYGHGTGTGGYVQGIDYINPALRPVFDDIANSAWKEVVGR